ncbi:MAG: preprotein translocase subunit SecG [Planctomycetota bacterium]|nr:preprotein translocase subunit SecG [Planctomycetota bacterium]
MSLISVSLYIVFVLAAIVLVVVILLQEGKGGGLTDALGTSGQQTFGVGASGINKFTGWVGAIFLASALGIHVANRSESMSGVVDEFGQPVAPIVDPNAGTPPPADSGTPPPTDGGQSTPPPANPPATPPEEPK